MLFAPLAMHTPDGFLSITVSIIFWVISVFFIGLALQRVKRDLGERDVPTMGVLAAAIFAGQMLNFAVAGGTSGHLLGAAIAVVLLGPWAAVLIMTCVVAIQALIFQDGGLLALGANLFNMAVIGPLVAWFVYSTIRRFTGDRRWGILAGSAVAAWGSIFIASLSCALQLSLSGTSPANIAIPAMAGIHALIGLGEALITLGAIGLVMAARPALLRLDVPAKTGNLPVWIGGGVLAVLLAVLSPLASSHPDGLEWVAEQTGFIDKAVGPAYEIIPDYVLPGISNPAAATILAGIVGVVIVGGAAVLLALSRKQRDVINHP